MFQSTSTTQVITPFGSGYVPLQHGEPTRWYLAPTELNDAVAAMRASAFGEILKSLRSALNLK